MSWWNSVLFALFLICIANYLYRIFRMCEVIFETWT